MRLFGKYKTIASKKVPVPIPTLALDFINGIYQFGNNSYATPSGIPGYNFSNPTGGYIHDTNAGLLKYFAPNTPRIVGKGLFIEPVGTNILLNSLTMQGANWTNQNGTTTPYSAIAPDGTNTATLSTVTATATPGGCVYTNTAPLTVTATGVAYTYSAYMKAGTTPYGVLIANCGTPTSNFALTINLTTGVITSTFLNGTMFTNTSTSSTYVGNGWYRVELRWVSGATGTVPFVIQCTNTATPSYGAGSNTPATAGQTIYWWGGQVEQSSVATSYIPTYNAITNICQQSNYLNTAPWTASGITVTNNAAIAPDGSNTASSVNVTVGLSTLRQQITVTASTQYTFSFYAKRGTATEARYSVYNITASSELIVATSYYSQISSSKWTKVSVTFTTPVGCTSIGAYPMRDSGQVGTTFIWGCQLEIGGAASTFVPCSPAVTNYCLYSQQIGGTGWTNSNGSATLNNAVAPDGTTTATLYTTTNTNNIGSCSYRLGNTSVTAGQVVTNSIWIKAGVGQYAYMTANAASSNATVIFDVKNGAVTKTDVKGTFTYVYGSITADPRGNGWFRCSMIFTQNPTAAPLFQVGIASSATPVVDNTGNVAATAGNTMYFWGAQQELAYGPNQYILTTTASASVAAQTSATVAAQSSATRTPDTLIYGTSLGLSASNTKAMVVSGSFLNYMSNANSLASLYDSTTNSFVNLGSISNGGGNFLNQILASGSLVKNLYQSSPISPSTLIRKAGASFGNNQLVVSQNGLPVPDTALGNGSFLGTLAVSQLYIGYAQNQVSAPQINGYIQSVKLYGSALSQNQLNTLTSLNNN